MTRTCFRYAAMALAIGVLGAACRPVSAPGGTAVGASTPGSWDVCFSPGGHCTSRLVDVLAQARSSIFVQAYSFTSTPIATALVAAHRRGVRVEVLLDKSQPTQRDSLGWFLLDAGVPVAIDAEHSIAHNKVMVIDGTIVVTGSFNFTRSAEVRNAENLLIVHDPALAARYYRNWQEHAAHARPADRRDVITPRQ